MKNKKEYRPDIDVLRALAVLSVVFYHAHIPFFGGGFIGVSIFFVISGYLITGIIKRKTENRSFSFLEFYENRIRRILPALTVMILTVIAVYYIFTSHMELLPLQRSVKRAIVGFANIHFYFNTDYFDQAAETMPLLHTWSLGVEEQFYFIIPALLVFLYKKYRAKTLTVLWILLGISFAASLYFVHYNQKFAFYMLPTRAWELLLGSVLAYTAWTPKTQRGKFCCTLCGLLLIILPVCLYDSSMPFPGAWALPPCLGACLYIAGGTNAERSILHTVTYNRPLLFIGLISYSLYLWHWPIFVFYQTFPFYKTINVAEGFMLSLLAVFIAALSWKFVENPFRYRPFFKNRKVIWSTAVICIGEVLYLGTAFRHTDISVTFAYTVPETQKEFNSSQKNNHLDFVIIGDSHARCMSSLLEKLAVQNNLYGQFNNQIIKNCINKNKDQKAINASKQEWDNLSKIYKEHSVNTLIIIYRLTEKLTGKDIHYNKFSPESPLVYLKDKSLSPEQALYQGLKDSIEEAKKNGVKHIWIQKPLPEPKAFVPQKASLLQKFYEYDENKINAVLGESIEEYQERTKAVMDILHALQQEFPDIRFIDAASCFLDKDKGRYLVVKDGISYYYDDDHPSVEGSFVYQKPYQEIMKAIAAEKTQK